MNVDFNKHKALCDLKYADNLTKEVQKWEDNLRRLALFVKNYVDIPKSYYCEHNIISASQNLYYIDPGGFGTKIFGIELRTK